MGDLLGNILKIQRYSINDGPGIRTTVFLKGCPLRCQWCHNPDSQRKERQLMFNENLCTNCRLCERACPQGAHNFENGKHTVNRELCTRCEACVKACPTGALSLSGFESDVESIMKVIVRDKDYYRESGGGVTLSGGEPLMQPEFTKELIRRCHALDIKVCLDTCGHVHQKVFAEAAELSDCLLYDLKMMDSEKHRIYTGVDNALILDNFKTACRMGKEMIIRQVILPGINDNTENSERTADFLKENNFKGLLELLPYHSYGKAKYKSLGWEYALENLEPPKPEQIEAIKKYYEQCGLNVKVQ